MYAQPINGVAPGSAAPTLHLGTYRRAIMSAMSADCFTPAERLRANHSVYECQDSAKLALWLQNVTRVRDEREAQLLAGFAQSIERGEELVAQSPRYATPAQCDEIYRVAGLPCILACEKSQALLVLPTLTYAGAVRYIGQLYAKVLRRTGQRLGHDGSTLLAHI